MSIRTALPEDLEMIVNIYNQAIAAGQLTGDTVPVNVTDREQWFNRHNPDKYPILVKEKDDAITGYLTISPYRRGRFALRHTAEVSFYVDFDHHRQGVATQLLQRAIDICPSLHIKNLFAILMETNTASIEHLKKFGFDRWGHMPLVADYDGIEIGQLYYGLRIK